MANPHPFAILKQKKPDSGIPHVSLAHRDLVLGALKKDDLARITVDTTVQEKAVRYPTGSKFLNRSRERLISLC